MKKLYFTLVIIFLSTGILSNVYGKDCPELIEAAKNGDSETLENLLNEGCDVNSKESNGHTPLIWAIKRKDFKAVKLLIDRGADVNIRGNTYLKDTPLDNAIIDIIDALENGDSLVYAGPPAMNVPEIVNLLLQSGAIVDSGNVKNAYETHDYKLARFLINIAIKNGVNNKNMEEITAVVADVGDMYGIKMIKDARGDFKEEIKNTASKKAETNMETLTFLIDSEADMKSEDGGILLINAALSGNGKVVESLIKSGANVNAKGGDDRRGTPLIWAAERGYGSNMFKIEPERFEYDGDVGRCSHEIKYFVKAVSEGTNRLRKSIYYEIDVDTESIEQEKPWEKRDSRLDDEFLKKVKIATENGHFRVLNALIKNGADLNATNSFGETALMKAAEIGDAQTVKVLLENGANASVTVSNNYSALEYALDNGNLITAKIISDAIATSGKTDVKRNYIAPLYSFENGGEYIRKILKDDKSDVNALDENGFTALIHSVIREDKDAMEALFKRGADVNAKDKYGNTALMYAVRRCNPEIEADESFVTDLIKKGANVNASNNEGETVFMWAVLGGSFHSVDEALYAKGVNVNAKTKDGITALMFAVELDRTNMRFGDVNDTDNNGKTALIRAVEKGQNLHAVDLIIRYGAKVNIKDNFGKTALGYAKEKGYDEFVKALKEAGAKE